MTDNIITLLKNRNKPKSPNYPDITILDNGSRRILNTADNLLALCKHIQFQPALNKMNYSVLIDPNVDPTIQTLDDLKSKLISEASKSNLPKATIEDHLYTLCAKNMIHPVRAWLETDKWDGVQRVDSVIESLNFKHKELSSHVMKHWLVSAVAVLYEKIFSTKLIPILQGKQSWKKTASLSRICNLPNIPGQSFLTGKCINPQSRDSKQVVLSSWIVELGEFESTSKMESGPLKTFFTDESDTVRYAYVSQLSTKPRQTVFIGTVNGDNFLHDRTGNSRFMVLPLAGPTDIENLNSILGWEFSNGSLKTIDDSQLRQFWLEVKSIYDSGHGWVLPDVIAEQAEELNQNYMSADPLEERVDKRLAFEENSELVPYTASEICDLIGLNPMRYAAKLGELLTSRYPNSKTRIRINGKVQRVYMLRKLKLINNL